MCECACVTICVPSQCRGIRTTFSNMPNRRRVDQQSLCVWVTTHTACNGRWRRALRARRRPAATLVDCCWDRPCVCVCRATWIERRLCGLARTRDFFRGSHRAVAEWRTACESLQPRTGRTRVGVCVSVRRFVGGERGRMSSRCCDLGSMVFHHTSWMYDVYCVRVCVRRCVMLFTRTRIYTHMTRIQHTR